MKTPFCTNKGSSISSYFLLFAVWIPVFFSSIDFVYPLTGMLSFSLIYHMVENEVKKSIREANDFKLKIKVKDDVSQPEELNEYYNNFQFNGNSGLDIFIPKDITIKGGTINKQMIPLGIMCEPNMQKSYDLRPRSSFSKTPLILGNHIGTIDATYRGELMAAVKNLSDKDFEIKRGDKLFQIVAPTFAPFKCIVLNKDEKLSETVRGDRGFGSTGR